MAFQNEPLNFGRNAGRPTQSGFGRASIHVAIAAFALVLVGVGVAWTASQFGFWQQFASILILGLCFGFAPLLHVAGVVVGLIGLFKTGDSKGLSILGILLNVVIVACSGVSGYLLSEVASSVM